MPISCFDNLIGVRGLADEENPDSGYYINDLPGITTAKMEDVADIEEYQGSVIWDDIYNMSVRLMENDIKTSLRKYYRNYSYRKNGNTGRIDITNTNVAAEGFYSGWQFDLVGLNENLSMTFDTINVHVVTGDSLTVKIWDAITGEELFTETFTVTIGFNAYRILQSIPLWKHRVLFIGYDATLVTVKQVERFDISLGEASANHVSTSASVVQSNITGANTGMMLNYNIECSIDNFVCQRVDLFKDPFLYKLGIEFCNELLYSDRINRFTLMDRDDAMVLREEFITTYKSLLDNIFKDIHIHDRDECFECAKEITYSQPLP